MECVSNNSNGLIFYDAHLAGKVGLLFDCVGEHICDGKLMLRRCEPPVNVVDSIDD